MVSLPDVVLIDAKCIDPDHKGQMTLELSSDLSQKGVEVRLNVEYCPVDQNDAQGAGWSPFV